MSRGKPSQEGVRAKLPEGTSWEKLGTMTPEEIKASDLFPPGFMPLSHPNHPEGGMVFPKFHIDEIKKQEDRDLTRYDLDFDLPEHFLPEFPPAIYLTTRPDLGDVSQGKLVTLANYFAIFNGILNPKQLEGMRLLVTPFPQQQFNSTDDRRTVFSASLAVSLVSIVMRMVTPTEETHLARMCGRRLFGTGLKLRRLRGVHIQRLFGSQRALRSVEDFTEFEQGGAYFDGDHVIAAKKGVNRLDRSTPGGASWPSCRRCWISRRLRSSRSTASSTRGKRPPEELRRARALFRQGPRVRRATFRPYYTDNLMHNLKTERFFKSRRDQQSHGDWRWADQDLSVAQNQGLAALPARWAFADA